MRPNILIFMTDQEQADVTRSDHPCYTPHAQALARDGVAFRWAFCPTAHCCPSRATFFSGLFPSRHGIYNNISTPTAINRNLEPGVTLFSEWLKEAGYNLTFSGKWHITDDEDPEDRDWEQLTVHGAKHTEMQRPHRPLPPPEPRKEGQIIRPGWWTYRLYGTENYGGPRGYEEHFDYETITLAQAKLPELARQREVDGKPWCLYVGPMGPHDPFIVPERFLERYDADSIDLPENFADNLLDKPRIYQRLRRDIWGQLTEREVRNSIAHYWAYCTMEDELFGEILASLDATGQADDTLVLRLSDHGEYAGAHGLYAKGVPAFREGYHIPAIARWPNGIANPGREVEELVTLADFAPTFADLAEAKVPEGLTGRSLAPFLRDETVDDWPDTIFTQFNGVELYYSQRTVRTRDYKLVYNGFDFDELYDLRNDPHEMVNLADLPEWKDVKRDLFHRLWRFAFKENDLLILNSYITVALAPWGPMDGIETIND